MFERGPAIILEPGLAVLSEALSTPRSPTLAAVVYRAVSEFNNELNGLAQRRNLPSPQAPTVANSAPIIMTGHQPIVYHPGLLQKELTVRELAERKSAFAVNVILDIDEGDDGTFPYPSESWEIKRARIATGSGLFAQQSIISLSITDLHPAARNAASTKALALYAALAGESSVVSHAFVRSTFHPGVAQLRFSTLLKDSASQKVLAQIAQQPDLARTYNDLLAQYRLANKIKNNANPFPSLLPGELPLWLVSEDRSARKILKEGENVPTGWFLAPRGALVSLFLRCYCSDLFIHGLGGRTYDRFTDQLVPHVTGATPPLFGVVSANRYLFANEIEEFEVARSMAEKLRSAYSHLDDYIARNLLTESEEKSFAERLQGRRELLQAIEQAKQAVIPSALREVATKLKLFDEGTKQLIATSSLSQRAKLASRPDEYLRTIYARDYPFFMFTMS